MAGPLVNPGDFLVFSTAGWEAHVIQVATRSRWNHAAVYIGDGWIIEANPAGVQRSRLSKYDGRPMLCSDLQLNSMVARTVVGRAEGQLGLPYGWLDVAAIGLSTVGIVLPKLDDPDTRFCSQVVALALAGAGVSLTTKAPNRVTPGDLGRIILGQPVPANW